MAIEIADLPLQMVIFHSYVSLPEGKRWKETANLQSQDKTTSKISKCWLGSYRKYISMILESKQNSGHIMKDPYEFGI